MHLASVFLLCRVFYKVFTTTSLSPLAFHSTSCCSSAAVTEAEQGLYGEPARPDCHPHGFMTANYTCSCWDNTIYKGVECKESCVQ